jgi:REP element-mobilizing transposase RayT
MILKRLSERLSKDETKGVGFGVAGQPTLINRLRASHESSLRLFRRLTRCSRPGSGLDLELKMGYDRVMARPLRIDIENGLHHVTSRGWERRVMVRNDADCQHWLELLDRVAVRCGWRVFAWVLMTNHWHLYLRTPNRISGAACMISGYASAFNRRHRRCGALYQGRFKAVLVEELGSEGWVEPWRQRLAEQPDSPPFRSNVNWHGVLRWRMSCRRSVMSSTCIALS